MAKPVVPFAGALPAHKINLGVPQPDGTTLIEQLSFDEFGQPVYGDGITFTLPAGWPFPQSIEEVEAALLEIFKDENDLKQLIKKDQAGKTKTAKLVVNLLGLSKSAKKVAKDWVKDSKFKENKKP